MSFLRDLKVAIRSLARARALWFTVAITLALGIGANAAIFSVIRGVLLRPLANRDEDRLLYVRQSAPGIGADNTNFSVPEINDIGSGLKSIKELGTFSAVDFTLVGLGEPREIRAGVVDGNYFEVMGLRPVLGRLLNPSDDGPNAAGAVVLTYRFWVNSLHSDRDVIGKVVRLGGFEGTRSATIVGVLEPSVPYPVETEMIANIVTSPHHLSATMVTGREHRMTEVFARLAPGADLEAARAELRTVHTAMVSAHPEVYKPGDHYQIEVTRMHDQINSRARTILWVLFAASGLLFVIACSNVANLILARAVRREPEMAIRAALGSKHQRVPAFTAGGRNCALRQRRSGRAWPLQRPWWPCWLNMLQDFQCARLISRSTSAWFGSELRLQWSPPFSWRLCLACLLRIRPRVSACRAACA